MMIRTQISLDADQKRKLDKLSLMRGQSMSELVRQSLDAYLKYQQTKQAEKMAVIKRLAGCMADSPSWKNVDAVEWQRKLRHEKGI